MPTLLVTPHTYFIKVVHTHTRVHYSCIRACVQPDDLCTGVYGAAVACVPFQPVECEKKIDAGFNKHVYVSNFLRSLKRKAGRVTR
jgi:hypothetical protein